MNALKDRARKRRARAAATAPVLAAEAAALRADVARLREALAGLLDGRHCPFRRAITGAPCRTCAYCVARAALAPLCPGCPMPSGEHADDCTVQVPK